MIIMVDRPRIDESRFASEALLQEWCDHLGASGYRGTGGSAHERVISWIEQELRTIPGLQLRADEFELLRWQPVPEGDLEHAGALRVDGEPVPVGGAVPYSAPGARGGGLAAVPRPEAITAENAGGRIVLRDFPELPVPYDLLLGLGLHVTPGCDPLRGQIWDRPGLADPILHEDLLAAGRAGAAGVVFAFDLPRHQIAGYYEPHKGTHYRLPAVFVGVDERERLRRRAEEGATAEVVVGATVTPGTTRNLFGTLPGRNAERIVLVSHTDGNTWVQENGAAALLALARYFAAIPIDERQRTLEFAFTSAHLHISREGSVRYAAQLDEEYDGGTIAFAFPIEHLGARELVPVPRADGPGRELVFREGSEPVLWAVGPSEPLREAVLAAVTGRNLDRVLVAPGLGAPVEGQVPRIVSFGGLGTAFHMHLVPTTSIITGPWSLWAPAFAGDAVDIAALRQQVLAAGDVVAALDGVPLEEIAGGYPADRAARAAGAPVGMDEEPPEVAPK
jgi:hypothetical protein